MPSLAQPPIVELSTLDIHLSPDQKAAIKRGDPVLIDANRNSKGQFVRGNTASEDNEGGRPCKLCENEEAYMKIVNDFYTKCRKAGEGKVVMPWFEELALDLDCDDETVSIWATKMDGDSLEHPEFSASYAKIKTLQKLRLQQRLLGRYNPSGAIKLLEWNHNKVSANKQIIAGDSNQPLQVEIIEERRTPNVE